MNKDQKLISAICFFLKKVLETGREGKCAMRECHGVCNGRQLWAGLMPGVIIYQILWIKLGSFLNNVT